MPPPHTALSRSRERVVVGAADPGPGPRTRTYRVRTHRVRTGQAFAGPTHRSAALSAAPPQSQITRSVIAFSTARVRSRVSSFSRITDT